MNNLNILEVYEIEMVEIEEQYEVKSKKENKLNRYKINKRFKNKDRKIHTTWKERSIKECRKKKAERKVRYSPIGKENFSLKGCGYHKIYEYNWDMD